AVFPVRFWIRPALLFPTCLSLQFTPTADLYTLSLHDALPIFSVCEKMLQYFINKVHENSFLQPSPRVLICVPCKSTRGLGCRKRSEEHTSELQSRENLLCRLLLEQQK